MAGIEDFEKARDLAGRAMDRMLADKLAPNPENFTLWYAYFGGQLPDLTRAIDIARRDGITLSQTHCDELFKRFFTLDAEAQAIRETSERARTALGRILDQLGTVGSETDRYGQALAGFRGELDQALTVEELRAMVAAIAAETTSIVDRQARLQGQLQESSQQLAELRVVLDTARREAMTDGLTGIANRRAFDQTLVAAVESALKDGTPLSLLMVDIDHFKTFNDTHGHLVGDHVLKLVAKVLTEGIKGRDTVARYGGEEFAVVLPRTELTNAVTLADQLRASVGSRHIVNRARNASYGSVTLSIGAAQYRTGEELMALLRRADEALYAAKRGGRNRVAAEAP
ncbi:GGDEF domain-containing protein [Azospirillum rugosum]|uniref:diguanylate cyclase n=1 Tax=Azospirillum rugosum TaxID=416170 RepID=A0ABS4SN19_9PROT|nr:GGDEF domain-containing protein [Azospirillum rugosum]MBP2293483.1 diguanylate cyclase [Azospirillum rugosum]MDQ0530254.1 diguanylate cyclase [Azospirillum rugosum]